MSSNDKGGSILSTPFMSVCIPTYNRANQLKKVIKNILDQNFEDFEIIIVDNNSSDHTSEIIASYEDKRIRFFNNEFNIGAARNHNRCLVEARGKYIKFLHSDDRLITNSALQQFYNAANEHPDVGLITCGASYPSLGNVFKLPCNLKRIKGFQTARESMTIHNFGLPSDWLIKREILPYTGSLIDSHICDCDFVMKAVYYYDCYTIATPLVEHHLDGANETLVANRLNGWEAMRFKAFKHLPFYSNLNTNMKACISNFLHMAVLQKVLSWTWKEAYHNSVQGILDLLKHDPHLYCFQGEDREKLLSYMLDLLVDRSKPEAFYEFMFNQTLSKPYADVFKYGFPFTYQLYGLEKQLKISNKQIAVYGNNIYTKYLQEAFPELSDCISTIVEFRQFSTPTLDNKGNLTLENDNVINLNNTLLLLAGKEETFSTRYLLMNLGLIEGQHFLPIWEMI